MPPPTLLRAAAAPGVARAIAGASRRARAAALKAPVAAPRHRRRGVVVVALPPPRATRVLALRVVGASAPPPAARPASRKLSKVATALHAAEAMFFFGVVALSAVLPPLFCLEWWALLQLSEAVALVAACAIPLCFAPLVLLRAAAAARRASLARAFAARDAGDSSHDATDAALAARKASLASSYRLAAAASRSAPRFAHAACVALAVSSLSVAMLRVAAQPAAWAPPLALAVLAGLCACAPLLKLAPLLLTQPFEARERRLMAAEGIEAASYDQHDVDDDDAPEKQRMHTIFASAVADALRDAHIAPRDAHALLLHATGTGLCASALEQTAGMRRDALLTPSTGGALVRESPSSRAFCADAGALLRHRPAQWESYDAVWLDYASSPFVFGPASARVGDLAALFAAHALAPGGVLGLRFTHREGATSAALRAEEVVEREAARRGYGVRRVARHCCDGACFLAFRLGLAETSSAGDGGGGE